MRSYPEPRRYLLVKTRRKIKLPLYFRNDSRLLVAAAPYAN
jgi:hypothetical protein